MIVDEIRDCVKRMEKHALYSSPHGEGVALVTSKYGIPVELQLVGNKNPRQTYITAAKLPPWQEGHPGYDPAARDPKGFQWDRYGKVIPQLRAPKSRPVGIYASLGNPELQEAVDTGARTLKQKGGIGGKIVGSLAQSPDAIVTGAGAAALLGAAAPAVKPVATAAVSHPVTTGATVGTVNGINKGIETGDLAQGVSSGLNTAAMTTAMLGGPLWAAGLEDSLGAAADRIAAGGTVRDAALDAALTGGVYASTGAAGRGMGYLANKVGPRVASVSNRVVGPVANRIAANPIVKPVAKAVQKVVKSAPKPNMSALAAEQIAPAAIDVKDAVGELRAKRKHQAEELKKWLRYAGAGLGGILTFMLVNSMLNSNSGSSGSDKKREESTWERLLKSVLAAGVGAAGAYGGYKLGQTAYDHLYNQYKYEVLMNQIKRTGGAAWNKVKSLFS